MRYELTQERSIFNYLTITANANKYYNNRCTVRSRQSSEANYVESVLIAQPGMAQRAKAMMISFWDGADKSAFRIDLWTKDMMVDEMADFFYQTFITMADTYNRATQHRDLAVEMKTFAKDFYAKFRDTQLVFNYLKYNSVLTTLNVHKYEP